MHSGAFSLQLRKFQTSSANAKVSVEVKNKTKKSFLPLLKAELRDKEGNIVASSEKPLYLRPGKQNYAQLNLNINEPQLWSPEDPNLYNLNVIIVKEDESMAETWKEKVGFRNFKFDPDEGFFLNGNNMLIKGCLYPS